MKRISSEITGVLKQVETRRNSIGAEHGETGSGELAVSEEAARGWLIQQHPAEVDQKLLTSLRSSLGVEVYPRYRITYPSSGGYCRVYEGCDFGGEIANRPKAYDRVKAASTTPTRTDAENWLVMLQVATAGAKRSEAGSVAALELYVSALCRFPCDIAKTACVELATESKWFPTLSDLIERCDKYYEQRKVILVGLSKK